MRKRILLLVLFGALAPVAASAQVVITEIMYDLAEGSDSGREWIEVFNAGAAPIDITAWRLREGGVNHKITAFAGGNSLAAGTYAVIADNATKFMADWPQFQGQLFDSAFSLSNSGELLVLRAGDRDIDAATYTRALGGDGTGDSLQRNAAGAAFEAGVPTPGASIPAGGLAKSVPKATPKQSASKDASEPIPPVIGAKEVISDSEGHVAAVGAALPQNHSLWWLAPLLLAGTASAGIVWARRLKKDEWDIIEEVEEKS
ncbi:MAG TPA: lamin tail domain-containing protein [Candidatus Paceibacterota bacterium]|nr:lamin tail domain-containing protein [Candidatus Paceibacterota bacterium]